MFDKLKNGYTLFIRYDDYKLNGFLTLRKKEIYKDIIKLDQEEMKFLLEYPSIFHLLDEKYALSISYEEEKNRYISSIKKCMTIGEYNDEIIWNDIMEHVDVSVMDSLNRLNDDIEKNKDKFKKDITLVILAAGMGSRFGGLKQIEPVGPNGELIIDYSIYDAIAAGFNKVIFIIQEENYSDFKQTIGKRIEQYVPVSYVFQKNDRVPDEYQQLKDRKKPLGTAYAFFSIETIVKEPFMIINADDFYGKDAYIKAAEYLQKNHFDCKNRYGLVGYLVKNTMADSGAVKRGICEVKDHKLVKLTESNVEKVNGEIIAKPLNGDAPFKVFEDQVVSMNMLLFNGTIFPFIEKKWTEFLEANKDNLDTCEFLIPNVLFDSIQDDYAQVDIIRTTSTWYGVTYRQDLDGIKKGIKELIHSGSYPLDLWNLENDVRIKKR